ncbi:MAG: hypothetical protein C4581_04845 [Nitrospiraceae bacterium]|nr:MAG: hypothetical protein C4581_04845 [Nitrospiraceae bacterium]
MIRKISVVALCIILLAINAFADDVSIDSSGNVKTGVSNANAEFEVTGGSGEGGILGSASGTGASGVYGINTSFGDYGILGYYGTGVYGYSTSGWAGYFQGNAQVTGNLTVGGTISASITESDPSVNALGKASLSCSEGQVPKFVGGSWACGNDIDTNTDTQLSESTVEAYITNGPVNLSSGTTIGGVAISDANHTHPGTAQPSGVAVVAISEGDYTDPVTAMGDIASWCGSPSAVNPCLLKIMPGVYDIGTNAIQMVSYVDIEGSGENVTKITGSVDNADWFYLTEGLIYGADYAELRFLAIENTSTGNQTITMINDSVSPKISNVTIVASGGIFNYGMYNNSSGAIINAVTLDSAGSDTIGMFNEGTCTIEVTNSRIRGATYSVSASPGAVTLISGSKLDGTLSAPSSTIKCFGVYDAGYLAVTCP